MLLGKKIPGIDESIRTDLPVLRSYNGRAAGHVSDLAFSRWLASPSSWMLVLISVAILFPGALAAQTHYTMFNALAALWKWLPLILMQGFFLNILIRFLSMLIGTASGILLGLMQISLNTPARQSAFWITQLFRNSPWLVILFIVLLALPFDIDLGFTSIRIPDWTKAVFGLSLPVMANISEVVRGGVLSVPSGQWEAAESLAYSRHQTMWFIILPQCFKRMIPPWMNWYAILTMATPLVSLLGVEEIITISRQAMEAEDNHPELLIPFYGFALIIFFVYCYPIARMTLRLEKRFSVKL